MTNYFEERKKDISNQVDDMIEVADQEGYHRGFDEAYDEAKDKYFDKGFEDGEANMMNKVLELVPSTEWFPTPSTQEEYEQMMEDYSNMGPMCVAIAVNYINKTLKEL